MNVSRPHVYIQSGSFVRGGGRLSKGPLLRMPEVFFQGGQGNPLRISGLLSACRILLPFQGRAVYGAIFTGSQAVGWILRGDIC